MFVYKKTRLGTTVRPAKHKTTPNKTKPNNTKQHDTTRHDTKPKNRKRNLDQIIYRPPDFLTSGRPLRF